MPYVFASNCQQRLVQNRDREVFLPFVGKKLLLFCIGQYVASRSKLSVSSPFALSSISPPPVNERIEEPQPLSAILPTLTEHPSREPRVAKKNVRTCQKCGHRSNVGGYARQHSGRGGGTCLVPVTERLAPCTCQFPDRNNLTKFHFHCCLCAVCQF